MPVEIEDSDQLNTVSTLLNDDTGGEAKPWSDVSEKTKILTVLDDPTAVEKGRQKVLNSLEEMGAMTAVKRSEAVGKRVIQTRWVDREKDGRVKSQIVSEGLESKPRPHSVRDVCTDTIDTGNNVGCEFI